MGLMNQPEFESEVETNNVGTIAEAPAVEVPAPEVASTVAAPAVVQAQSTAVAAPAAKFHMAFADKQLQIPIEMVEQLSLGAYRVKGEQGSCYHGDENLGAVIRVEVVSINNRWAIGTGNDKQTSEDKERFRVSYDGKTIAGEETTVAQYIESLKAEGYAKAKSSPYIDLWGFITWTEKKGDVDPADRQLALVQLSQTSAGNLRNFMVSRGMLESKGLAPLTELEVVAQAQSKGTNKYTNFNFRAPSKK